MFVMVSSVFSGVFASVSDACFKCFIYLYTYVVSVASRCYKSRLDVTSLSLPSAASLRYSLFAFCCLASFSDYGEDTAGAGGEKPREMAAQTGAAFSPSVTWAGIVSFGLQLVGRNTASVASLRLHIESRLAGGSCVRTCYWNWMSRHWSS
jgi:hypothetical protein